MSREMPQYHNSPGSLCVHCSPEWLFPLPLAVLTILRGGGENGGLGEGEDDELSDELDDTAFLRGFSGGVRDLCDLRGGEVM